MGRYGTLWVAMGHFSPPLGQTSQRPKPLKGVGMGWPMGWDEMGSKTGSKTGSKRHSRMTYAGPILVHPRRSHTTPPAPIPMRLCIETRTPSPSQPYAHAQPYAVAPRAHVLLAAL